MSCYGPTETEPFMSRDSDSLNKSKFYISNNEDYNTDIVEFKRAVNILEELVEVGIISEEEETRRKLLLNEYLRYQRSDVDSIQDISCYQVCVTCIRHFHHCWDNCLRWVYYTETD